MTKPSSPILSCLLLALAACGGSGGSAPPEPPEPTLELLPGTGIVAIAMNDTWRVDEVVVLRQASNATLPLAGPAGFMPPIEGALMIVANDAVAIADERPLQVGICGVGDPPPLRILNVADGRRILYYCFQRTEPIPGTVDGGSARLLQFVLGSVDEDTIEGLVQHYESTAFPPRDRPVAGTYRVTLRRYVPPVREDGPGASESR